ncbi:hypothetical protein ACFL3G_00190 [Planctomycetota bacterium]
MLKDLGILLGGVFVGAVAAEVIRKKCPALGDKLHTKICNVTSGVKEAFKAGYENATQPRQTVEVAAETVSDIGVEPA